MVANRAKAKRALMYDGRPLDLTWSLQRHCIPDGAILEEVIPQKQAAKVKALSYSGICELLHKHTIHGTDLVQKMQDASSQSVNAIMGRKDATESRLLERGCSVQILLHSHILRFAEAVKRGNFAEAQEIHEKALKEPPPTDDFAIEVSFVDGSTSILKGNDALEAYKDAKKHNDMDRDMVLEYIKKGRLLGWPHYCVICEDATNSMCDCGAFICGPTCRQKMLHDNRCKQCAFFNLADE